MTRAELLEYERELDDFLAWVSTAEESERWKALYVAYAHELRWEAATCVSAAEAGMAVRALALAGSKRAKDDLDEGEQTEKHD